MRFARHWFAASLLAFATSIPSATAQAQDADPVAALLRAEADRRDAAAAQLGTMKVRVAALDARLDAADAKIVALVERLDTAMTRLTAAMEALDVALVSLRGSMDLIDARLRVVETAPPAPVPVPPTTPVPTPSPGPTAPPAPAPAQPFTWTPLTPSADTRTFYVSTSGNDAADGLSPETAVRTPMVAYDRLRTGFPDWMLLKRGDTWDAQGSQFAFVGEGGRSGRSADEPLVIGSYGDATARPRLLSGRFRPLDGDRHVRVVGLEFQYAPPLVTDNGIVMNAARVEDILVEDCAILGYPSAISLQGQGKRPQDIRIRGCVVADSLGQGILASGVDGLLIDGCVFDHNGWREDIAGFPSNGFNHNMYLAGTNTGVVVRDTISARASSHAISMSAGGLAVDNLVLQSPIGIWGHLRFAARNNVILDGRDIEQGGPRGMALGADEIVTLELTDNVVANAKLGSQCQGIVVGGSSENKSVTIAGNLIHEWTGAATDLTPIALYWYGRPAGTIAVTGNTFTASRGTLVQHDVGPVLGAYSYQGNRYTGAAGWRVVDPLAGFAAWVAASGETDATTTAPSYPDPARTIETYSASLGGTPTLAWFMGEARKQSKLNWRWAFTARVASNYVREGFGMAVR